MQSVDTNFVRARDGQTDVKQLRYRPISLAGLLRQPGYPASVLMGVWLAAIALCTWWGIYGSSLRWNPGSISLFGLPGIFDFYIPWVVMVPLVMWFGLEWAAIPAYLATFFNDLHTGDSWDIAAVDALHNPLGMTVFFLLYSGMPEGYALRTFRSWRVFILASIVAGLTISVGAIIWQLSALGTGVELLTTWISWWLNFLILALVIDAPIIYFLSPAIERLKQRYVPHVMAESVSPQKLLLAASMFSLTLALFILGNDHWQAAHLRKILAATASTDLRAQVATVLSAQRLVVWTLGLLLAGISLGGILAANHWIRRIRERADALTQETRSELQRSEARFRNFFENNPAPMWVYEPESGRFLEVNRAAIERYGYSREAFLHLTIFDIRPLEDIERLQQQIKSADRGQEIRQAGEWRHRRKDGTLFDVEVHVSPMKSEGRIVQLALVHDISPRKQAQATMERRARELQTLATASLEITAAQTMAGIMQIAADRARQLLQANLAVTDVWPGAGMEGIPAYASCTAEYARWADSGVVADGLNIYRMEMDQPHPVRFTAGELEQHPGYRRSETYTEQRPPLKGLLAVPLATHDGAATGMLMVSAKIAGDFDAQDEALLTQLGQVASVGLENVRLNAELRRHMQELEGRVATRTAELDASNRELDAFAYSVAHDLRAPLRAMHGFADAVLDDYGKELDDAASGYLVRIVKASENMDALIQDLLAYSRVSRAHMRLESVPVGEVIREVLADLAHEIESRHAQVRVDALSVPVLAHSATLKQVILNLVSNALKFVVAGRTPDVHIRTEAHDGFVDIVVSDNGIGIAPEHRERIFNVFERLHGPETYSGTGIGLSIVKRGLARMQGEIMLESGENGSSFRARLREFRHG